MPDPLLLRGIVLADRVAQRAVRAAGVAELRGELREQVLAAQVAARPGDLVRQHFRKREVLKERDDVGEGFVERQDVRVGRLHEVLVEAVEQRMRRLVRDDVVRQAREDHAAGELT